MMLSTQGTASTDPFRALGRPHRVAGGKLSFRTVQFIMRRARTGVKRYLNSSVHYSNLRTHFNREDILKEAPPVVVWTCPQL